MSRKFGVDSSSHFPFSADTDTLTHTKSQLITLPMHRLLPVPAWVIRRTDGQTRWTNGRMEVTALNPMLTQSVTTFTAALGDKKPKMFSYRVWESRNIRNKYNYAVCRNTPVNPTISYWTTDNTIRAHNILLSYGHNFLKITVTVFYIYYISHNMHILSAVVSWQALDQQRSDETRVPTTRTQTLAPLQDEVCATHCCQHKQCIVLQSLCSKHTNDN